MAHTTDGIPPPFSAYQGTEPYIFASYSHEDKEQVYPIISWLYQHGYPIWYDEGIYPGKNWLDVIPEALSRSAFFVVFISPKSVKSKWVNKEIGYAVRNDIQLMAVYLEDTILPKKLDFLINEIQAVTKPEKIEVHFYHQIERAFSGSDIKTPVKRNQENALSRDLIEKYNMVLVKSGTFQMGSNDGDDRNKPVHTVTVSDFYIGKYEVTQAQWQAVMGTNPSKNQKGGNYPVGTVSWNDCQKFIKKLNQQTGEKFRLPTEAEWEYAAIGGDQSRAYTYSGSNTLDDVAWYRNNSDYHTHPIGQKKPNELGLHDMSGNVWEWCQDWYAADYYQHSPQNNPSGPKTGSGRVLRGGSFFVNTEDLRCSIRLNYGPDLRNGSIGFRLVRAL